MKLIEATFSKILKNTYLKKNSDLYFYGICTLYILYSFKTDDSTKMQFCLLDKKYTQ